MDFERLVSPITDYLNFSISFWSGDFSIFDQFKKTNEVLPEALLLSLVGIGFMLVIRYARFGSVPRDKTEVELPAPSLDTNSLILFSLTSLATPLILELSFWMAGSRHYGDWSLAATFNASFLTFALVAPISGLQTRINYIDFQMKKVGGGISTFSTITNLIISAIAIFLIIKTFIVYPVIFDVEIRNLLPAAAIAFGIFVVFVMIVFMYLFWWNKYLESKK